MTRDPKYAQEDPWLVEVKAGARNAAAAMRRSSGQDVDHADLCINCQERWCLAPDRAACPHRPICDDCWPNGCPDCEAQVEADLRRREEMTERILSAVLELRTTADDVAEADLLHLGWIARKDIRRHVGLAMESLRRVADAMDAQTRDAELHTGRTP